MGKEYFQASKKKSYMRKQYFRDGPICKTLKIDRLMDEQYFQARKKSLFRSRKDKRKKLVVLSEVI